MTGLYLPARLLPTFFIRTQDSQGVFAIDNAVAARTSDLVRKRPHGAANARRHLVAVLEYQEVCRFVVEADNLKLGGRGVFKPKELREGPLTLVSSLSSTYEDEHLENDEVLYDYAPAGFDDWANDGLKRVAGLGRPVILLKQVAPKPKPEYMIFAPVMLVAFDDAARKVRFEYSNDLVSKLQLLDYDGREIALPKNDDARPSREFLQRRAELVA